MPIHAFVLEPDALCPSGICISHVTTCGSDVWIASTPEERSPISFLTFETDFTDRGDDASYTRGCWHSDPYERPFPQRVHVATKCLGERLNAANGTILSDALTLEMISATMAIHASVDALPETKAQFLQLLLIRLRHAVRSQQKDGNPVGTLEPWQQGIVQASLDSSSRSDTSLQTLASRCGLSICHFSRLFKSSYGMPLHQFVMQYKIARASTLLAETNETISHIALECGFSDQSSFTRRFTAIRGTPPALWRRTVPTQSQPSEQYGGYDSDIATAYWRR